LPGRGDAAPLQPGFGPIAPRPSLSTTLVERLRDEIESGRLVAGDRLPSESRIVASFGVSRSVVREAIAALRADGLVTSHQGRGIFVAEHAGMRPFRIDPAGLRSLADVLQVMELRTAVEIEMAGLAAVSRTTASLRDIGRALARMDAAIAAGDAAIEADRAFHAAIAKATRNPYFERFLELFGELLIPRRHVRHGDGDAEGRRLYLERIQEEHRAILLAIEAKDPAMARKAARTHLANSRNRYRRLMARAGAVPAAGTRSS
jgi:GntR family transcriptional repressor for pyruvate dehydrogenase complex